MSFEITSIPAYCGARRAVQTALMAVAIGLTGCATGPQFKAADSPAPDKGRVYVYRPSKLIGFGNVHQVRGDSSQDAISLPNASWLKLDLNPGIHAISIQDYFGFMKCGTVSMNVQAGQVSYVVDNVNTTQGLNQLYVSCSAATRTEEQAKPEITGLSEKSRD